MLKISESSLYHNMQLAVLWNPSYLGLGMSHQFAAL